VRGFSGEVVSSGTDFTSTLPVHSSLILLFLISHFSLRKYIDKLLCGLI
jgi:hypothetical protein